MAETGTHVFGSVDHPQQLDDLRECLIKCGATELPKTFADKSVDANLRTLLGACHVLGSTDAFKNDSDIILVLNSLMTLIVEMQDNIGKKPTEELITTFVKQLSSGAFGGTGWSSRAGAAVRVLSTLFHSIKHPNRRCEYIIYMALVDLCSCAGLMNELPHSADQLKKYFEKWDLTPEEQQSLMRALVKALGNDANTDAPAEVMLMLMGSYADDKVLKEREKEAAEDARISVRQAIADPRVFVMDHLLQLKPVQLLQSRDSKIWKLLQIFISGSMADYDAFAKENADFLASLELSEEALVRKMRLLTLMSMAEKQQELGYDEVRAALRLNSDEELEECVIAAIVSGCIRAKLDGAERRIHCSGSLHRQFTAEHWQQLLTMLRHWETSLKTIAGKMDEVNDTKAG